MSRFPTVTYEPPVADGRLRAVTADTNPSIEAFRNDVRRIITNAYYDARNRGDTMERAANDARDGVLALFTDPSYGWQLAHRSATTPQHGRPVPVAEHLCGDVMPATGVTLVCVNERGHVGAHWAAGNFWLAADSLGLAWAEVESLLPNENWHMGELKTHGDLWRAVADGPIKEGWTVFADGPTPTAALTNLADRLREKAR